MKCRTLSYLRRSVVRGLAFLLLVLVLPGQAEAAVPLSGASGNLLNLDLKVLVAGKPLYFILVEKDFQRLRVLEHDGRLNVVAEYFVATGENFGRKLVEGDEKTPEGVYFITKKYVDSKITVFGQRAFHLNYPNVYDANDGRDGNGIFIHGTNKALRANSTNGCITLNNTDLDDLAQYLSVGSIPVIIVSSLDKEGGGEGLYPDLAANDFSLAKNLLFTEGAGDEYRFVSLFLIRAAGQTVVAGEYKEGMVASQSRYSAAYLDISQENGWVVAERGPTADGVKIAPVRLRPIMEEVAESGGKTELLGRQSWSVLWEPDQEALYLGWYRDSLAREREIVDTLVEAGRNSSATGVADEQPESGHPYGLIIFAACLSAGSVLLLKRNRPQAASECAEVEGIVTQQIERLTAEKLAYEQQLDVLQEDLQQAKDSLRLVQTDMQEEKCLMERELQARIEKLESALTDKQSEVDQLVTQKAALQLKGMAHLSGQIEELTSTKNALAEMKGQLEDAQKASARIPVLESMVQAQKEETNRLAMANAALQINDANSVASRNSELQGLQNQVAMLGSQLSEEIEKRKLIEGKSLAMPELERELSASKAEAAELRAAVQHLEGSDLRAEFEQELTTLRGRVSVYKTELASERENQEKIVAQLQGAQDAERTLSAQVMEFERLVAENTRLQEELAAKDHDDELALLRERLSAKETELTDKAEEASRLSKELATAQSVQEALSESQSVAKRLQAENSRLQEELAAKDHEEELALLRERLSVKESELTDKAEEASRLSKELATAQSVQDALSESQDAAKRLEAENSRLQEELAAKDHEEELALLRERLSARDAELHEQRAQNRTLDKQVQEFVGLEEKLYAKRVVLERLEGENKALRSATDLESERAVELTVLREQLAEKNNALDEERRRVEDLERRVSRLAGIEEHVLARQVEVTSLTNEIKALKAQAQMKSDQMNDLRSQLDSLRQALEAESARSIAAAVAMPFTVAAAETLPVEEVVPELQADLPAEPPLPVESEPVAAVESIKKPTKPAYTDDGLLSHGTQFLPEDVLRKWIGQG